MLDRLAQAAERQNQLDAMVERLVRQNGELRGEMDNLRSMVTRLTEQRAERHGLLRAWPLAGLALGSPRFSYATRDFA